MQKLAKVALDVPVNKAFDYSITDKMARLGSRVSVPFGKTKRIGVIIDLLPYCEESQAYKIKSIDRLIDCEPIISPEMLKTCKWAASYYHHPIWKLFLPQLHLTSEKKIRSLSRKLKTLVKLIQKKCYLMMNKTK